MEDWGVFLTVLMLTAKILGLIEWSWWVVFLPILIQVGLFLFIITVALILTILIAIFD